jgi:hypothetical protein
MKWVCITDKFENFTYGNIYEGDKEGNLLNIPNDKNEFVKPAISGYKSKNEFVEYFITLDNWEIIRKEKAENIAKYFWESFKII